MEYMICSYHRFINTPKKMSYLLLESFLHGVQSVYYNHSLCMEFHSSLMETTYLVMAKSKIFGPKVYALTFQ